MAGGQADTHASLRYAGTPERSTVQPANARYEVYDQDKVPSYNGTAFVWCGQMLLRYRTHVTKTMKRATAASEWEGNCAR